MSLILRGRRYGRKGPPRTMLRPHYTYGSVRYFPSLVEALKDETTPRCAETDDLFAPEKEAVQ